VFQITDEDRTYWAFQPLRDPRFLADEAALTSSEKIDRLISRNAAESETAPPARGLASPRQRLRRLFLDLWGLPPSNEQVEAFQANPSPEHWQAFVNQLLASRHYGERWGRYWLDWVRFAETNGYERDAIKPNAWRFRDYVIDAFEQDKPYDQFIIEQLAGDEWANEQGWTVESHPRQWRDAIIATGFYRLHVWDDEPDDTQVAEFDDADDIMVSIGSAFLGLTIGCARCHDHKFDPISQNDYYSMLSFLRGIEPYGLSKKGGGGRGTGRIQRSLVPESETIAWEQDRQNQIAAKQAQREQATDPAVRLELEGDINQLRNTVPAFDSALAVWERGDTPQETFVLHRGDPHSPRELVSARVPTILESSVPLPANHVAAQRTVTERSECGQTEGEQITTEQTGSAASTGGRLQLAKWMVDPRHPLTARVIVNRVWQRHFGEGIVPTIDDFGATGLPPQNVELLDFLASELIRSGWSLKHMHRIILTTQAYQQSTDATQRLRNTDQAYAVPQLRRLDAEAIRDSILSVTGRLGRKRSGTSVYPRLTQDITESANPVSLAAWQESPPEDQHCRSVYLIVKRSLRVPFLEVLDYPGGTAPTAIRSVTTTAPQALLMLNDPWMDEQAHALNERAIQSCGLSRISRIEALWKYVYQRTPSDEELRDALEFLGPEPIDQSRWIRICRSLLNSSEFLYME
jgi:hypothetical protein